MIDETMLSKIFDSLNDEQLKAVACDVNCVVTSGAGSGKTTVLSYRFLRLVAEGKADVDGILTLTFSRAAAAEMKDRIHRKLLEYQDDPDIQRQLLRFPEATIATIDSFCNRIVASDPTRYGIGPDFMMDEDANREMAIECAYRLFTKMEGHPGLDFLASLLSPQDLVESLLVDMACTQFHPSNEFNAESHSTWLIRLLGDIYEEYLARSISHGSHILQLDGSGITFEKNREMLTLLLDWSNSFDPHQDHHGNLALFEQVNLAKCRGKKDFVEPCNELIDLFKADFRIARIACAGLADQSLVAPMYEVLETYRELYLTTKRERGILTFGDVADMARDILLNNMQVRRYYQQKFPYIMIDEFQDTNGLQRDIVYLLAQRRDSSVEGVPTASDLRPDALFFVGDQKQSIYRFRGADVAVFKAVGEELVASGGKRINLQLNYRSEPTLIEFFNKVFSHVMGDASEKYEAEFEPLQSRAHTPGVSSTISLLLKPLDEESADDDELVTAVQAEAHAISQLIHRMMETDEYLVNDGEKARRPGYNDIAILFRTSSNQMHYEKALRLAGIPYTLAAMQSLFLEAPTNDIYHMLQLVVYPDDRLAFAAALRSPFCRLSDDAVLALLDEMDDTSEQPVFLATESIRSEDDRKKYQSIGNLYGQLCQLVTEGSVGAMVSHLWYWGGYRSYLLGDPLYQVYLEHFDFLHELAIRYDMKDLGLPAFLDFIRPKLGQNEKLDEVEPLHDSVEGVSLMTVHKSKGLEFPIVILANMGGEPRAGAPPVWIEFDGHIIPSHMRGYDNVSNVIHEMQKPILRNMETAEMKRLFYVALTRAKCHLVLAGSENKRNMGEKAKEKNFLALLFDVADLDKDTDALGSNCTLYKVEDAPKSVLRAHVSLERMKSLVHRMQTYYDDPLPARQFVRTSFPVTEVSHTWMESDQIPREFQLPAIPADPVLAKYRLEAHFGTYVHLLLQKACSSDSPISPISESDARNLIPHEIERLDLMKSEKDLVVSSAVHLANNFLSSQLLSELLAQEPISVESEVAFVMKHGEKILHGSIDLLLLYDDCVRVIDFKTDSIRQPEVHETQLTLYHEAAYGLYGKPVHSTLCYVRSVGAELWIS